MLSFANFWIPVLLTAQLMVLGLFITHLLRRIFKERGDVCGIMEEI